MSITRPSWAALGRGFRWVFAASTLTCLVAGASTPFMVGYALDRLEAPPGLAGLLAGSSSIAAIALRPYLGRLADRHGLRLLSTIGCAAIAVGALVLILAQSVAPGTAGRVLAGLGGAAANTALMAWVIGLAPIERRGRALGIFGVSVWAGLAAGPQLGQTLVSLGGYTALWGGCGAMGLLAAACVARASPPGPGRHAPPRPGDSRRILRLVARPGAASGIAWAGEGLVLTFLVVHLEGRGLPAGGLAGAATVFTVFALSVIAGRVALVGLVDRIGPVPAAAMALLTVAAGLVVLALAGSFAVAACGGVLLGAGFAPLFPALALLATERLRPGERAAGVGVFSAFMDAGIAAGAILGGLVVAWIGSGAALATLAVAQLGAIALVLAAGASTVEQPGRVLDEHGLEEVVADASPSQLGHDAPQ